MYHWQILPIYSSEIVYHARIQYPDQTAMSEELSKDGGGRGSHSNTSMSKLEDDCVRNAMDL